MPLSISLAVVSSAADRARLPAALSQPLGPLQQLGRPGGERLGRTAEAVDRDVPQAALDQRHVGAMEVGALGKRLLGEAPRPSTLTNGDTHPRR